MAVELQLPKDTNRFCRACMNVTEDNIDCFDNHIIRNNEQTELCKLFTSVTSLTVVAGDGLPETICQRCTEQITALYIFRNQCENADKEFRDLWTLTGLSETNEPTSNDESVNYYFENGLENNYYECNECHKRFISSYSCSMHMIDHDMNKSLSDQFINNRNKNLEVASANVINLIEERKTSANKDSIKSSALIEAEAVENSSKIHENTTNKNSLQKDLNKLKGIFCKICLKAFKNRKQLRSHICKPTVNACITCSLCKKAFPNSSILSLHFLKHCITSLNILDTRDLIENEIIFCEVCGKLCESEPDLDQHYEEEHDGRPSTLCVKCCQTFDNHNLLSTHDCITNEDLIIDHKADVLCVLCNVVFDSSNAFVKHTLEHLIKKYTCKKCLISFCTRNSYYAHFKSHAHTHYDCSTCGTSLSTKGALRSHIVGLHSNELLHTCSVCGKGFSTPSRLNIHSKIHKQHKKYVCSYCGYSAHKCGDLKIHVRIHTRERPYKCTFANCNSCFKTSSHLCEHLRRHLQIKKYKCTVCGTGLSSSNALKIHHMQHTGEKPFTCTICNVKFRRKYHVKIHMKQHQSVSQ